MPQAAIPALLSGVLAGVAVEAGVIAGITIGGTALGALGTALVVGATSLALGGLSAVLAPKPPKPSFADFTAQSQDRVHQFRQPITNWSIYYGEVRCSGPVTFMEVTDSNKFFHVVVTLASHASDGIPAFILDDTYIYPDQLDADGLVTSGRFANKVRLKWDLGTTSGQPFPSLVSATQGWTDSMRQYGRTKVYARYEYDRDVFPGSLPNLSVWLRGKKVFDTRTGVTKWSPCPPLCVRDYMVTPKIQGGMGTKTVEVDHTFVSSEANVCEEFVSTARSSTSLATVTAVNVSDSSLDLAGPVSYLVTGDRVHTSTTGSRPAGLPTTGYAIVRRYVSTVRVSLADSYSAALGGTPATLSSSGSGALYVIKTGEPRYTLNGGFSTDKKPIDVLTEMLSAMGGRAVYAGGTWKMTAARYVEPSASFDQDDLRSIRVKTRHSSLDRFNTVKGVFTSPLNLAIPTDYPPASSVAYRTADGGAEVPRELHFAYTNRPLTSQRLANIELERHRRELTVFAQFDLSGMLVQAGDTIELTYPRYGFSAKVFEVATWRLTMTPLDGGGSNLNTDMVLREIDAAAFSWSTTQEGKLPPARRTNLPKVTECLPPAAISVSEELYQTTGSAGLKNRVVATLTASPDFFAENYRVDYKVLGSNDVFYTPIAPPSPSLEHVLPDLASGWYTFRAKAVNTRGVSSPYIYFDKEVLGLLDPPVPPPNPTISAIGGFALIRFDRHPALDVRIGGSILVRHTGDTSGLSWQGSVGEGRPLPGDATNVVLPLRAGSYLLKAVDQSGVPSTDFTFVTTEQATILDYVNLGSVSEHPPFAGNRSNVVVVDEVLRLGSALDFDDVADVDALASFDYPGGVSTASGTYSHAVGFDFGSSVACRLTVDMGATVVNVLDLVDSRTEQVDEWEDWDGTIGAPADAQVYVRHTDDDPAGSPSWSGWERLSSAEFRKRGFDFETRMATEDAAFNILVDQLTIRADAL